MGKDHESRKLRFIKIPKKPKCQMQKSEIVKIPKKHNPEKIKKIRIKIKIKL